MFCMFCMSSFYVVVAAVAAAVVVFFSLKRSALTPFLFTPPHHRCPHFMSVKIDSKRVFKTMYINRFMFSKFHHIANII